MATLVQVKTHGARSWLNMKNHPENVISHIVKNAWGSHTREDVVCISAEHTTAWPSPIIFFLWRRPDKTDIPEVIWADKRIFRAPAPRESSIIFHDLAFMLQKHVCSQNSAANGALHTVFKSFRNIFTGFSGKDKRVHRLPRVQK